MSYSTRASGSLNSSLRRRVARWREFIDPFKISIDVEQLDDARQPLNFLRRHSRLT